MQWQARLVRIVETRVEGPVPVYCTVCQLPVLVETMPGTMAPLPSAACHPSCIDQVQFVSPDLHNAMHK